MKMKVRVTELKSAIVKHQTADEKRFKKELVAFNEAKLFNRRKRIENLDRYLRELKQGEAEIDGYNLSSVINRGCRDEKAPSRAAHYGDLLVKLNLCVTDTVTVDDNSVYMRFLSGKCVC